jgi:drug/metabolite transporter (DMT)-like permease
VTGSRPSDVPGTKVLLAIISMCVIFGGSFVASKNALSTFTPAELLFLRFAMATGAFLAVGRLAGFRRPPMGGILRISLLALLEPVFYFYMEAQGIRRTLASTAAILISTIPLFVLVLEALWLKVRVKAVEVGLVILSMAGIGILVSRGGSGPFLDGEVTGNLLVLGAALSASFYTVLAKDLLRRYGTLEVTTLQCAWAALFFLPLACLDLKGGHLPDVSIRVWTETVFLGLGCSFLAYWLLNYSLTHARAGFVAAFTNLIPVVSMGLAALLLGERLQVRQLSGALLVLAGLVALSFVGMRNRRAVALEG